MRDGMPGLCCAIALYAGTCGGLALPATPGADLGVDVACVGGIVFAATACVIRRHRWIAFAFALAVAASIGFIRGGDALTRSDVAMVVGFPKDDPSMVRFRARMLERFVAPDHADMDVLDSFQAQADSPTLHATAQLICFDDGVGVSLATGVVTLVIPGESCDLCVGDRVQGVGWLTPSSAPSNPGERDLREGAWQRRWVGRISLEAAPECVVQAAWYFNVRGVLQQFADTNVLNAMGEQPGGEISTLVVAMTTGRRLPGYAGLRRDFSRTGLSHFLAISGFNVAVLFAACVVLMELLGVNWRCRGWLLMATGFLFLIIVDVEVSVLRAGVAGVMAGSSLALGRGWRADGLLATAAIGTLMIDPWSAHNAGFQLSYMAVLALRHGSTPVDRMLSVCWPEAWRSENKKVLVWVGGCRLAFSASVAAWLVSTPITLFAFGSISPWCAVASTLLGPLAAILTVIASMTVVCGWVPLLGWLLGKILWMLGWMFLHAVWCVGTWPACNMVVAVMPWWWAVIALVLIFVLWGFNAATRHWQRCVLLCVLVGWWCAPMLALFQFNGGTVALQPNVLCWTALAIGDGSVHVVQCGGETIVFDAGSISRTSVGTSVVVPALRAIGVTTIDTMIVSHPHLDHYSALPEIVNAFRLQRVVLTEMWKRANDTTNAAGFLLAWLRARGVVIEYMVQGDTITQGPVVWLAMHPQKGFVPTAVNDGSLGFLLCHQAFVDRPAILFLGDAQDQAIARYLARRDILRVWAMELPHHGGWRPIAQALCEWVHPEFVVQSTGQKRFTRDRFGAVLADTKRGVTCRDGALRFTLDPVDATRPALFQRWMDGKWVVVQSHE